MLSSAIGGLLPSAIAVALSPFPIVAVILMLSGPRARRDGPLFAVGWVVGLVLVSVIVVVVTGGASNSDSATATGVNWFQLVVGVIFLAMAGRQWRQRPRRGQEPEMPKWMATVDDLPPGRALVVGLALSAANPKNLALTAAAAATIAQEGLSSGQTAVAIAVFVVLASTTVVGSVLFYLLAPDRAAGPLAAMKEFMSDHNAVIMMVILLLLGAKLIGAALPGITR